MIIQNSKKANQNKVSTRILPLTTGDTSKISSDSQNAQRSPVMEFRQNTVRRNFQKNENYSVGLVIFKLVICSKAKLSFTRIAYSKQFK
jgi:hypothetical protein